MGADAFGKLPNAAGWQPALPGKNSGTSALPRISGVGGQGVFSALILSPAKRLRSTPLRPSVAALFHRARSVNFSQCNRPESAIRDARDRSGRRAEFLPAGRRRYLTP